MVTDMLVGITINIIFFNLFTIWFAEYKKQEKIMTARAKFRAELKEIIDKHFSNIEFDTTWEESSPDTLLDWYIHQEAIKGDINEK